MVSMRFTIWLIMVIGVIPLIMLGSYLISRSLVEYGVLSASGGILLFALCIYLWRRYGLD